MDHKRKADDLGFSTMTGFPAMPNAALFDNRNYSTLDEVEAYNIDRFIEIPPPPEYSEVVDTPNSCSISSSSTEAAAANDDRKTADDGNHGDEDEDHEKSKKQLSKPRKKKQKKEREARFAFMTKSDVDHLDDGYRWRKYGQKAVKNSPFPRSYYRCTSTLCGVKKRVERSNEDPSTVVTTYEGTHTHPCPIMPRGSFGFIPEISTFGSSSSINLPTTLPFHDQQAYVHHNLSYININPMIKEAFSPRLARERPFCPSASAARDIGLLQDMLPSKMMKEAKEGVD